MSSLGELDAHGRRSFAVFVHHSRPVLRRVVARLVGPHLVGHLDADDLVQIAYEDLLKRWDDFDNEVAAHFYAERIARSRAANARRDAARRGAPWLQVVHGAHAHEAPSADDTVLPRLLVRAALNDPGLTDDQRAALLLVDVQDFDAAEAAQVLGRSHASLKGLLQRGRKRLRDDWAKTAPGLVALLPRGRRPAVATAAFAAPALMALVVSLAVLEAPHGPPAAGPSAVTAHVAGPTPSPVGLARLGVGGPAPGRPLSPPSTSPAHAPAPSPAPSPSPSPSPSLPLPHTGGGACVGDTCAGDRLGDRVCARTGVEDYDPACANQDYVGVCSVTPENAYATCHRDTEPMVDPTPPPRP